MATLFDNNWNNTLSANSKQNRKVVTIDKTCYKFESEKGKGIEYRLPYVECCQLIVE